MQGNFEQEANGVFHILIPFSKKGSEALITSTLFAYLSLKILRNLSIVAFAVRQLFHELDTPTKSKETLFLLLLSLPLHHPLNPYQILIE